MLGALFFQSNSHSAVFPWNCFPGSIRLAAVSSNVAKGRVRMPPKTKAKTGPKDNTAQKPKLAAVQDAPVETVEEVAGEPAAAEKGRGLKLRELVGRVVDATGAKKKDARAVVEATLEQLGEALAKGEELNLPGVGRVRVARSVDRDGRALMTLKVRGVGAPKKKEPKEALAEAEEAV